MFWQRLRPSFFSPVEFFATGRSMISPGWRRESSVSGRSRWSLPNLGPMESFTILGSWVGSAVVVGAFRLSGLDPTRWVRFWKGWVWVDADCSNGRCPANRPPRLPPTAQCCWPVSDRTVGCRRRRDASWHRVSRWWFLYLLYRRCRTVDRGVYPEADRKHDHGAGFVWPDLEDLKTSNQEWSYPIQGCTSNTEGFFHAGWRIGE